MFEISEVSEKNFELYTNILRFKKFELSNGSKTMLFF